MHVSTNEEMIIPEPGGKISGSLLNLRVHFLSLHLTKVGLSLISETSACTRSSEGAITNDGVIGWNSINIMVVKVHTCKSYLSSYTSLE